jgi:g-D-glutamyl-meso-diaminopimelate peptidase
VRTLLEQVTFWFVPMVNPDGVTLAQLGLDAFPAGARETLLTLNGGSADFRQWKANAQGVDLNRQYPADWEHIVGSPAGPAALNYKGPAPLVAPEVKALADFTRELQPELAIAYHSAGRVIYWHFHTAPEHLWRDERIALRLGTLTGYSLVAPEENPSGGGYKDWFVQEFGRPGYTIEIGEYGDGRPLSVPAFAPEWDRNQAVGLVAAQEGYRLWAERSRVRLFVDGVEQPSSQPAYLIGGQTFVPLPDLLTRLGAKVTLDEAAGTLTASRADATIQLTLGSRRGLLLGNPLLLPNPPLRLGGQFYGPLRFAAEEMGAAVTWDAATHSVQVHHVNP